MIDNCEHGTIHSVISLVLVCNVLEQDAGNYSMNIGKQTWKAWFRFFAQPYLDMLP